eukprot:TRINITY_DN9003_c0_g1_i1.p1 TRINITY_DN9003_c0_g1~~TRINITY_DN9003_c0_g1_i1.p1  ORF type:complete len:391 (-),score=186.18 TRINITY_DN9003_c0_g1_i1:13-1185(-)
MSNSNRMGGFHWSRSSTPILLSSSPSMHTTPQSSSSSNHSKEWKEREKSLTLTFQLSKQLKDRREDGQSFSDSPSIFPSSSQSNASVPSKEIQYEEQFAIGKYPKSQIQRDENKSTTNIVDHSLKKSISSPMNPSPLFSSPSMDLQSSKLTRTRKQIFANGHNQTARKMELEAIRRSQSVQVEPSSTSQQIIQSSSSNQQMDVKKNGHSLCEKRLKIEIVKRLELEEKHRNLIIKSEEREEELLRQINFIQNSLFEKEQYIKSLQTVQTTSDNSEEEEKRNEEVGFEALDAAYLELLNSVQEFDIANQSLLENEFASINSSNQQEEMVDNQIEEYDDIKDSLDAHNPEELKGDINEEDEEEMIVKEKKEERKRRRRKQHKTKTHFNNAQK